MRRYLKKIAVISKIAIESHELTSAQMKMRKELWNRHKNDDFTQIVFTYESMLKCRSKKKRRLMRPGEKKITSLRKYAKKINVKRVVLEEKLH